MIISSCPLRVSLVGGSTDNPIYLKKYKKGSVISFPSNLKTYTIIHKDIIGYNSVLHKYTINYSEKEVVNSINEIKNELIRFCFKEFSIPQINCYLTSDIFSTGSGLASSSSYLMSLIKGINKLYRLKLSDYQICEKALKIERNFNPLVGEQDFYGAALPNLKKITFYENKQPNIQELNADIFNDFDMYLYYTSVNRNSTNILKTIDIEKTKLLLDEVENLEQAITTKNLQLFLNTIKKSWELKKQTSPNICQGEIEKIDLDIKNTKNVLAHKLCGAGGGGYFLIITEKASKDINKKFKNIKKIKILNQGLTCKQI